MGSNDEFGPDTETIRAWLSKRATYAKDARVIGSPRGGTAVSDPSPPATAPEVAPVPAPAQTPDPPVAAGPDGNSAGRSVLAALGVDGPPDVVPLTPSADSHDAARSVVDALRAPAPPGPARVSAPRTPKAPQPVRAKAAAPAPAPAQVRVGRWTEPEENLNSLQASTDVDFPVRGGARRTLGLLLLAALAATAGAGYLAYQDQTPSTIGIAAVLGFLTLVIWAVRAGSTTTQLSIRRGQLTVRRGGHTDIVDIASHHTPIAIVGEPGHRRWTVLVERKGLPLVVINASMVDAHWFTSALYRLRPELRPSHQAAVAEDVAADEYADSGLSAGS